MGGTITRKSVVDKDTGELIYERSWLGYDGFTTRGYAYRARSVYIRYFWDCMPDNLSKDSMLLLIMLAELANDENVLMYRVNRKSKFSTIVYKPMDKEDIFNKIRYKFGMNKFDVCWRQLKKSCIRRAKYREWNVWTINPAVVSKCKYVPYWLYEVWKDEIDPHLSGIAIKKMEEYVRNLYIDDLDD